jgi:hypothetical protein
MHLWIVTIGSSDVQLDSNQTNQEKGRTEKKRSDKVWSYWYTDDLTAQYYDIAFEPKSLFKDKDETYRIAPRILGIVYKASESERQQEIWSYLTFPLLDNFVDVFRKNPEQYSAPEAIAVLLTDQSAIFGDHQRRKPKTPYWQDTCELKPILQRYFKDRFPEIPSEFVEFIQLEPTTQEQSLDNWNSVLELVRGKLHTLTIADQPIQLNPGANVYVSHQAGTPAISSAVQFCGLAKFGAHVKFLVSSEQNAALTDIVESSSYLRGIEVQQAKKLLEWHDYLGIKEVLQRQIDEACQPKDNPKPEDQAIKRIAYLLDTAIQWNFAKFEDFAKQLVNYSDQNLSAKAQAYLQDPAQYWWWEAYEAAYLGVVRLKQGNTVEAMFHSFRAVEGLLKKWLYEKSGLRVEGSKAQLLREVEFINKKGERKKTRSANAYGQGLYFALDSIKHINKKQYIDIWAFGNAVFDRRNELFHQLGGLQDKDAVFAEWKAPFETSLDERGWKDRVKNCLNFVSDQQFGSIEDASLMAKVHQTLERAIADL